MKRSNPVQVTLQDIIRRKSCKLVEPAFNFSGFTVINTPPIQSNPNVNIYSAASH